MQQDADWHCLSHCAPRQGLGGHDSLSPTDRAPESAYRENLEGLRALRTERALRKGRFQRDRSCGVCRSAGPDKSQSKGKERTWPEPKEEAKSTSNATGDSGSGTCPLQADGASCLGTR